MIIIVLARTINGFAKFLNLLILARCILSWTRIDRNGKIASTIYNLTEPMLAPIRRLMQKSSVGSGLMLDFSPVIAGILIEVVRMLLLNILIMFY